MSYNKRVWANGDLITKERMNNIENGIYDAHDKINAINDKVEENTTDTNTARQDISDIKLQIGTEELTTTSKKIKGAINDLSSQIKDKASNVDLDVERKRIDSFGSLKEGSTTGDAELIDGRIGANGIVYNNIGTGIRSQIKSLNENSLSIAESILKGEDIVINNKIYLTMTSGVVHTTKDIMAEMKMSESATRSYLRRGYELGILQDPPEYLLKT